MSVCVHMWRRGHWCVSVWVHVEERALVCECMCAHVEERVNNSLRNNLSILPSPQGASGRCHLCSQSLGRTCGTANTPFEARGHISVCVCMRVCV